MKCYNIDFGIGLSVEGLHWILESAIEGAAVDDCQQMM